MVGACTLAEEEYNRQGELLMVSPEWPSISILDAHCSSTTGLRQTVSDLVACSKEDPGRFFSCGYDGLIKLWKVDEDQVHLLDTWKGHRDRVHSIARHVSDLILASASQDGSVLLWPYQRGSRTSARPSPLFRASPRQGIPDLVQWGESKQTENLLFSLTSYSPAGEKGQVSIWDGIVMQRLATLQPPAGGLSAMAAAPDGSLLALGGGTTSMISDEICGDGVLRCYDLRSMPMLGSCVGSSKSSCAFKISTGHIDTDSIIFSPDSQLIISCQGHAQGSELKVYDIRMDRRQLHVLVHEACTSKAQNSPKASCISAVSASSTTIHPPIEVPGSVVASSWRPDGTLVTGGADAFLRFWDLTLADPEQRGLQLQTDAPISAISLGPNLDDTILLAGTESGTLYIWSASRAIVSRMREKMGAPGEGNLLSC